ncbi:GTPase family protein [Desulfonatronovibrio magnus]|uniref:GTPase family protein n=1 Tax=Desulfonatronovibrio magnus TaxID=698827 RepID=UPI0005EAE912|nr:GTPase [Desulfonatronovibrio magnus]
MKPAKDSFSFLNRLSTGLAPLVLLAVILPVVVVVGFGCYALFKYGYMLYFTGLLSVCAVIGAAALWLMKRRAGSAVLEQVDESMVQPSKEWSEFDLTVWEEVNELILAMLRDNSLWSSMGLHVRETAVYIAQKYHGQGSRKELSFSAIELLKMMEEVSRRYRITLKEHVPYIEKFNISTMKMLYDHKDKATKAGKIWNIYRTYRVFTPYGLLAEARGLIIGKMFSGVSQELQFRLKASFLQEVASVAIDLYSGRFRFDEQSDKDFSGRDKDEHAPDPHPLRVCVVGQVSAGKSAVINALTGHIRAEVSRLPSTDRALTYGCGIDGYDVMHLVDLPGLDGQEENEKFILNQIVNSDMVLWVVKASQSSKELDTSLYARINSFFMEPANRSRKKPVFIGVLTHIDRLRLGGAWQPPYDPESPDNPGDRIIRDALEYNKGLLKLDKWVPVCVASDKTHYNVHELSLTMASAYDAALHTQLNRRRLESTGKADLSEAFQRFKKSASSLFKSVYKKDDV